MTARCLLLAGSWGPERLPARTARDDADWVLPLHVRDEAAARERIAAQVAAGADVVVAPTWLTHRRALLPLAETRRAAGWTTAAVRVARDGVELGSERRGALLAEEPPDDVRRWRPEPRVAAVLPTLDEQPDADGGRLLPREAADRRDYRDQAGLLADAAPDLLLVEGPPVPAAARTAAEEACATGLPVWAALATAIDDDAAVEDWIGWAAHAGLERLLLPAPEAAAAWHDGAPAWGGLLSEPAAVTQWLAAGATALARLDGATVAALEPIRTAIDEFERTTVEADRAAERRWLEHVRRAAQMAPGGAALWLGDRPETPLPGGFDWLVVDPAEVHDLPPERYRLVICRAPSGAAGRLLEHGGVLACGEPLAAGDTAGLRPILIDEAPPPALLVYRRER
jgi:hypothetical protein